MRMALPLDNFCPRPPSESWANNNVMGNVASGFE